MGIAQEHTFVVIDATYDQLDNLFNWIRLRIVAQTRRLEESTGVYGIDGGLFGLKWGTLKTIVLQLKAPI